MARAAVIDRPRSLAMIDAPTRRPGPWEALVAIEGCGVCGSDLPVWSGRPWFGYPRAPGAPGHESWGTVAAVGSEVRGLAVGQRVCGLSRNAYAEYDVAHAADLVPLPDTLTGQPFPGEALGCAVNVIRRSAISPGDVVAVLGAGFLGCLIVQLAAGAGARVVAISRRPGSLAAAFAMGADATVALEDDAGEKDVVERVEDLTGGAMCDVVIEAAGVQRTLDLGGPLTRTRGRLVLAGFHQDGPRRVDMRLWNWRGLDVINAHERDSRIYREGMTLAVEAVAEGRLDPAPLYTHRFGLQDAASALDTALERPAGFMKALVIA